ncbi:MAG: lipoyl synthase [Candidatus Omnitrophica bacterium]|nr:lipoyl synthase [Candidatus Omnitrophota bacterium]
MNLKLPSFFKQELPDSSVLETIRLLNNFQINTVCQEAHCPNLSTCFKELRFTFMILGKICSRDCRFCAVRNSDKSLSLDTQEPYRIAQIVRLLNLRYVVITSVTRDDLPDGGASIFAKTVELIHNIDSKIKIELLIPDFKGNPSALRLILEKKPDILGHNLETVPRLYKELRPQADYKLSLRVLQEVKMNSPSILTKSSLMLGLGETEEEVIQVMKDLRKAKVDILTLGQYLAPSKQHYPVKEFITFEQFKRYQNLGLDLGFRFVLAGPKVRSSYKAEGLFSYV